MPILKLDHYTITPRDLDVSRRFYTEVLGLRDGLRPPFDADGAWLYCGDIPTVHLLVTEGAQDGPTGRVDHIAFFATGLAETLRHLRAKQCVYWIRSSQKAKLHQVFVRDPDGVQVEIGFSISEHLPDDLKVFA